MSACSASGNTTTVPAGGDNGNQEIIVTLPSGDKAVLQDLPTSFTAQYPLTRPVNLTLINFISASGTSELYGSITSDSTTGSVSFDKTLVDVKLRPLFNAIKLHGIARYKGTLTANNNTSDKGDPSDSLYNRLFTVQAGDVSINFGFFDINGTTKIYSYDVANNQLTDFELSFADISGVQRYYYHDTKNSANEYYIVERK